MGGFQAVDCPVRDETGWRRALSWEQAARLRPNEAARLELVRVHGWDALPSNNYRLERTSTGAVAIGRGQGHGLGLCQRGAAELARRGATFREILAHYFPNAVVM